MREIRDFRRQYPDLRYHITSGDTEQVTEKLDKGLMDFAVLVGKPDESRYEYVQFPEPDKWGLVFRDEDPLAEKEVITVDDLIGLPLFCSEQSWKNDLPTWCGERIWELHLEGSFRLSYNASLFAKEGLGYLLTLDHLVDTSAVSGLVFRPLTPPLTTELYLIWKKYQAFSPIAQRFLKHVKASFESIKGQ